MPASGPRAGVGWSGACWSGPCWSRPCESSPSFRCHSAVPVEGRESALRVESAAGCSWVALAGRVTGGFAGARCAGWDGVLERWPVWAQGVPLVSPVPFRLVWRTSLMTVLASHEQAPVAATSRSGLLIAPLATGILAAAATFATYQ